MTYTPIGKAQGGFDSKGLDTNTTSGLDFPTSERKSQTISTIRAQLALHNYDLTAMHCSDFLVHTYGRIRYCKDFDTLQAFAHRLGVSK